MKRVISILLLIMLIAQPVSAWWWDSPFISLSPTGTVKTDKTSALITFSASASDSDGVKVISLHVDGSEVASKSCGSCAWIIEKKCGWVIEKVQKCGWKAEKICKEKWKCWDEKECGWKKECQNKWKYKCWYEKECGWDCGWKWDWWSWSWKWKCNWKCWYEKKCGWKKEKVCDWKYKCWYEKKCGWKWDCWNEKKYECWYENEKKYKCWDEKVYKCNYPSSCSLYKTVSLKPGYHSVKVVAEDANGATSSKTFYLNVIVDKPPSVSISPSSGTYTVNNKDGKWHGKVTVSASDDIELDWVRVYVDNQLVKDYDCNPWWAFWLDKKNCKFDVDLKLSPGWHTVKAKAMDTGGHAKEATAMLYIKADNPPSVSLSPPGGTFKAKGAYYKGIFTAKATDDVGLSSLRMYLDGKLQASKSCSCPWWNPFCNDKSCSLSKEMLLSPGTHVIKVVATDTSGHKAEKQYTATVQKDNPPTVSLSPPGGTFEVNKDGKYVGKVTAYASDDSAVVSLKMYLDGSLKASSSCKPCWWCSASKSCSISANLEMGPGKHTVKVVAYDDGNQKAEKTYTFIIKDNPPVVSLSPPGGEFKTDKKVEYITKSFTATAADDVGVEYIWMYLDGKEVASKSCKPWWCFWSWFCSIPKSCSVSTSLKLTEGKHSINVKAKDTSGHVASKSWNVKVVIDIPPTVGLTPSEGRITVIKVPYKLEYSAWASDDKGLKSLGVYLDGKKIGYKNCKGTTCKLVGSTYLNEGKHIIRVEAYDTAGHVASKSYTFEIVKADVSVDLSLDDEVPYFASELPVTITIKKPSTNAVIRVFIDGKKVLEKSCSESQCSYIVDIPLSGLKNKVGAAKSYEVKVTVDIDGFSITKTKVIKVKRGSKFIPGSEITVYIKIDKGIGPVTKLELKYGGKKYKPLYWPKELNDNERKIVEVPFRIKITKSDYAIVTVCNAAGCDVKKMKIFTGSAVVIPTPTPTPTVTPTPTPTPTPTLTPTPIPSPTPMPSPTPRPTLKPTETPVPLPKTRPIYVVSINGLDYFAGEHKGTVYTFGYYNPSMGEGALFADPVYNGDVETAYHIQQNMPKAGVYEFNPDNFNDGTTKITESPWCSYYYNKQSGGSYVISCS